MRRLCVAPWWLLWQVGAEEDGATAARLPFDAKVIVDLYTKEMDKDSPSAIDYSRFMMLEFTGFLENYLWPNFAADSTFEHVMCIILVRATHACTAAWVVCEVTSADHGAATSWARQ